MVATVAVVAGAGFGLLFSLLARKLPAGLDIGWELSGRRPAG